MAQKWTNSTSNIFEEFNRTNPLQNSAPGQSLSPSNSIHSTSMNGHMNESQEIMMHPRNLYSVAPSSSPKETCLTNLDCGISSNNCHLIPSGAGIDQQSTSEQGSSKNNNGQSQNIFVCFICCCTLDEKNFLSIKTFMAHSHAPLLVLLIDVLGYKLDDTKLHSQIVCKSCYHLLDIIDELQQTLTESKTELRTKFLDTVQHLKLKYPRTDKMLKPRCLRCVQMSQSSSRKKPRGCRSARWKNSDDTSKGRGKGRGNRTPSESVDITNDGEMGSTSDQRNEEIDCEASSDHPKADNGKFTSTDDQKYHDPSPADVPSHPPSNMIFDTDPMFFSPDEKLKAGITKGNEESVAVFFCMYCPAEYENARSLKMHVRVYHMPILVYDNGQGTAETRYRMGIKLQNVTSNEISATEKPFACLFCISAYKLHSSLQFHFRENHSPHKPHQCIECKESFRRTIELSRHRLYRCPLKKSQTVHPKR